jgi:SAM-dependent methyltransferase
MSGIDLSPSMVEVARRAYPGVPFDEGSMSDLDWADGALGGIVAWYSIIHIPPDELPPLFAEFRRVLAPGGYVLLAFQVGDERIRVERGTAGRCRSMRTGCRRTGLPTRWRGPDCRWSLDWCGSRTRPRRYRRRISSRAGRSSRAGGAGNGSTVQGAGGERTRDGISTVLPAVPGKRLLPGAVRPRDVRHERFTTVPYAE